MWGNNPVFDLKALIHFLDVVRGVERPNSEFRLGSWVHETRPSPAALTYLKNGVEYYAALETNFCCFVEQVAQDYLSPDTTYKTFQTGFYDELRKFLKAELSKREPN